jgi:hypothetical protein
VTLKRYDRFSPRTPCTNTSACRPLQVSTPSSTTWQPSLRCSPSPTRLRSVNLASTGHAVLTERIDYINAFDGTVAGVPVMGTFVFDDDSKITRWTDYFDVGLPVKILQGEDISALLPAT